MPTTVTGISGTAYHLWQLPALSSPEPEDTLEFTTLRNDLGDGYSNSVLFGSNNGLRSWKLKLPTLAGSSVPMPTVTDINGATVSREQYLRSLYMENVITGTPFAYQDPHSGQYYLVDFADKNLTMQKMKYVALYGTGIELRQRRLVSESVFNVANIFGSQPATWVSDANDPDRSGNGNNFTRSGDVVEAVYNNRDVWRLNSVTTAGKLSQPAGAIAIYDFFIVMKVRETTFGQTSGVLTGAAATQVLIGASGQTKFTDLGLSNYEYRLNSTLYAAANQQAPMNTWGIVHLRFNAGQSVTTPQIGMDRGVAGTQAEIDIGEIIICTAKLPTYLVRELEEYLQVGWAIV